MAYGFNNDKSKFDMQGVLVVGEQQTGYMDTNSSNMPSGGSIAQGGVNILYLNVNVPDGYTLVGVTNIYSGLPLAVTRWFVNGATQLLIEFTNCQNVTQSVGHDPVYYTPIFAMA